MYTFRWLGGKMTELIEDLVYPGMWRVKWPDGEISDMVNKTRAKEAIRVFEQEQAKTSSRMPSRASEKPVGAFK
jgi:hypothetical protein